MSWLGGSISSITGQLSNLTKDILTEGTEEIDDPATELRLAKEKLEQLDAFLSTQRHENERLKRLNKELEEKAESSELQINAISREYRGVLESKEKEVNTLKQQYQELLEQQAQSAALSLPSKDGSLSFTSSHAQRGSDLTQNWSSPASGEDKFAQFNYEGDHGDWDFDDSIRLQRENNSLRSELQKLQSEVKHWRSVAGQLGQNAGQDSSQQGPCADVLDLQHKVKLLEAQLVKKGEEIQQQAASLHEHHRQKVSSLKSTHKAEVQALELKHQSELEILKANHQAEVNALNGQLSELEKQLQDARDGGNGSQHSGSGNLPESDRLDSTLRILELQSQLTEALNEKEQFQNACRHLESLLEELQQKVEQHQKAQSVTGDEALHRKVQELTTLLQDSETIRLGLERDLEEKNQLSQSLQSVKNEQEMVLAKTEATIENLGSQAQQEITAELFDSLERENLLLKEEKLKLEEHISLLEKAASTNAVERQTLLHRITYLKSQVHDMRGEPDIDSDDTDDLDNLSSASASDHKNAAVYICQEEIDKELALLRAQLANQMGDTSAMEMERADWMLEREALEDVITDLRKQSQEQDAEIRSLKSGKMSVVSQASEHSIDRNASDKLQALEEEIQSLREEKIELENALEELDTQHCQAQEQLIKQRDHLMAQLAERGSQIQQQQEEIEQLNNIIAELRKSGDVQHTDGKQVAEHLYQQQQGILVEQCKQLEAELADVKAKQKGPNNALEKEIVDLREKLHKGGLVINDLHMDKQELQEELKTAKGETAAKVAKIKEMREAHLILEREKKSLEEKILEMEDRLSDMEEEVEKWQQMNEDKQVQQMSAWKEQEEFEKLKSQVAMLEKEKMVFSDNFNSLSSKQSFSEFSFEDNAFKGILEEEARVRRKIEEDGKLILELRAEVQKLYDKKQSLNKEVHELHSLHEVSAAKITQLENELAASKTEMKSMCQDKSELEVKLQQESVKLKELSQQNDKLVSRLAEIEDEKSDLMKEIENKQIKSVEQVLDTGSKKILDIHREGLNKQEAEMETERQESNDIREGKTGLFADVDPTASEETVKTAVVQKDSQEKAAADDELQMLRARIAYLERSLAQKDTKTFPKDMRDLSQDHVDGHIAYAVDDVDELKHEIEKLKKDVSEGEHLQETICQLEAELTACNNRIAELHQHLAQANETVRCQTAGIADLNEKIDAQGHQLREAENSVSLQETTIAVLRQTSVDKEETLCELELKLNFLFTLLTDQQKEYLKNYSGDKSYMPALEYKEAPAIEFIDESTDEGSVVFQNQQKQHPQSVNESVNVEVNGCIIDDDFDDGTSEYHRFPGLEKEIDELRDRLREKDVIVTELQKSNSSLLALLEKGGGSLDKSLFSQVAVHKMEAELRSLRAEKEQMVAVVTEKSRENSSLKSEMHRLMDVVSAGQTAIEKLQQDNRNMEQRKFSPARDDGEDDMRREALANMARLVRDRETEIEALKQKNDTLLAVLQESGESQAAAHLGPLLRDKEALMQQLTALTSEREQLIACVTQKHSESLAYHAEVQRLTALLIETQSASEKVKKDYAALIPSFEDKTQALLAAQNELIKYKQKLSDLEVRHGELIQRSSSQEHTSSPELSSLESELERLRNVEYELRTTVSQQEEKIHMLTHKISALEESLTAKDAECAIFKRQMDSSKFQISGLLAEVSEMKAEREQIHEKSSAQDTESANLREAYNRMCLESRDKDIEVSSLREQVVTFTSLLSEQRGEQGQVTQLMEEREAVMASARQLQQERDQQAMLTEQKSQECSALRSEIAYLKEKELRQKKELDRLRAHLLEIEDGFTKDALEAEEREKDLRNRLAVAEEQLMSSSSKVENAHKESRHQLESLQQQLQHIASQRDSAYMQVANIQEQCQQYASSLSNLQLVLEHFQKEKDSAIAMETERLQNECKVLRIEVKELQAELQATRGDLSEALDGLEAASRLSEQLDRKEEALAALKEEVQLREQALYAAEEEIRKLNSSTEAKVDKTLMHNMVMTWMLSPEDKRTEIIHLMGNILSFSEEDFQKIDAAHKKGGLLSGFFRRTPTTPATPARSSSANQSFSQLFVKFLEQESSPPPSPMRLPAEAMAAETQHRHKPTFNPFMAPRHVTQENRRASTPSSHILMTPDSPTSSPLFTPLTSFPSSTESAILKDVLGNR
ncbi:hypothetical protein BsWGS_10819 [Bradybaena similaris]